jgi:hypothetical protein
MFTSLPLRAIAVHVFAWTIMLALTLGNASAQRKPEYTQTGRSINIGAGQDAGDVTCIACSIYIRGQVSGDATTVGGNIFIQDQGQVSGDATAVAGSIHLDKDVKVAGDATVVGGTLHRAEGAQVGGDVTSVGGAGWIPVIFITPLLLIGFLVAFVIWLVQRARAPIPSAAA